MGLWGGDVVTEGAWPPELRARVEQGVRGALRGVGRARRVSATSLLALICAGALAPVVTAGPLVLASVGVAGAVGGNILTDFIKESLERLRGREEEPGERARGGQDRRDRAEGQGRDGRFNAGNRRDPPRRRRVTHAP
jgi:hypothetical protein